MTKLMALIAFALLTGFLSVLVIYVPSPDLIAVVSLTVALAAYDFWLSAFKNNGGA